jgi:multimeric flavodoxin WrbA
MKVLTLLGSPRKNGNTGALLALFEREMKNAGHAITRINLKDKKINGCKGCYTCKKHADVPGCPQRDDASSIFDLMIASDAIVYASPLYCWCFPAQMKALIDRQISLVSDFETIRHKSLIEGKKTALLVTCEGPVKGNADLIQILFERFCSYTKTGLIGTYILPLCTTPDKLPAKTGRIIRQITKEFNNP